MIATDTQCLMCGIVFKQSVRKHGGGKQNIYCSPKCRSLHWARGNRGKRQASILKYEAIPENKEKKKARNRAIKFKKYNLTEPDFFLQLERQGHLCYGCGSHIDEWSARIDHNHITGKVRGLLCDHCNWALGHMRDKRETCYRLSAYLSYDRTQKSVYLIGSLRNELVPKVANSLRGAGFSVWDSWFSAGPEADDNFQKYHVNLGMDYKEALKSEVAQHIFYFDKAHLDLCDCGVLVMPGGKSCHLELGYMAAKGKDTYILLDKDPERYDIMPQFATTVCNDLEDLVEELSK